MATVKSSVNFKVENVDTLNTHLMQLMSGNPLNVPPATARALLELANKRFETNKMAKGSEFLMVDGDGKTVATFNKAARNNADLRTFMDSKIAFPAQQSFELCDKIIKCTKMHQQHTAHARLPSVNYAFGGYSKLCPIPLFKDKVAKQGHCFGTLLLALSYFVTKEFDDEYAKIINEIVSFLGAWPKLAQIAKICQYIIMRVPILAPVPIPVVAVNHEKSLMHICDQRGIPDEWHQLKMGTLAELANAGLLSSSKLCSYYVGGTDEDKTELYRRGLSKVKANLTRWMSKGTMIDDCARDLDLAAFIMLSPNMLSRLRSLVERDDDAAMKAILMDASCPNKLVVASAIKTAIQGVLVHTNETKLEKIWTNVNNVLQDHLAAGGREIDRELSRALHKLHSYLLHEKKTIFSYERRLYALTATQFRQEFGCSCGWGGKLLAMAFKQNGSVDVGRSAISLRAFDDGITHRTIEAVNLFFLVSTFHIFRALSYIFVITRILFYIFLTAFGCMSLSKLLFHLAKAMLIRRLAHNWERLMIVTSIFLVYELARFIIGRKATRQKNVHSKDQELQGPHKSSEKQMMAAMAMITLIVHAFDMDLAITMSSALNHVSRLANMLTDTTSGWLMGGTATEELQMHLFDVALEVDKQQQIENEMAASSSNLADTFSAWINENVAYGTDNTRPLTYGDVENVYKLDSKNGSNVGATMVNTKKAWSHVVGMTGSGKSTRVPLGYHGALQTIAARKRNILICEPTQATTQNVAAALSRFHGKQVYFKHEGREQLGDMSIQVMTYGSAFFRSVNNPTFLDDFDAVFLDESHLISPHSLALESLLNKHTRVRKFYLSATPRNGILCDDVKRRFEIHEHAVEACDLEQFIMQLGKGTATDPMQFGDKVLVFLASKSECDQAASRVMSMNLDVKAMSLHKDNFKTNYLKVVAAMDESAKVMVFSTNILETGVTLNVDVVVDFGWTNRPHLDLTEKTFLLHRQRVTKAERKQRIGRAGRLKEGHAIVVGTVSHNVELAPADVVYEAALLSFVYNLDIYVNSHFDSVWVSNITRAQARTMLNFRIPSFAMKDVVFHDGSVRTEFLEQMKSYTQRSANIKTTTHCTINHVYDTWPLLGTYAQKFGISFDDARYRKFSKLKVPFIYHEMGSMDLEGYAEAVSSYKPSMITQWAKPAKEVANVILHVNNQNVHEAINVVRSLIVSTQAQILSKRHAQNLHRESPLACFFAKSTTMELEARLGEQIKLGERNLSKLKKFASNLELFANINVMQDTELELTSSDMEEIGKVLELQQETTCNEGHVQKVLHLEDMPSTSFREAIVVGRKRVAVALTLMCIAAFGGLAWYYLWDDDEGLDNKWNKDNKRAVLKDVLEMKGKAFNRDKRNPAAYEKILHDDFAGDSLEDLRPFQKMKGKKKGKPQTVFENLMTKKGPFVTMYDVTSDENVVNAVFLDTNKQAFYETGNPLANMKNVRSHLEDHLHNKSTGLWSEIDDDEIFCDVTKKDGMVIRIRLTPHKSMRLTSTSGRQGYSEHDGDFRQTGDAEILKQPDQILEVDTRLSNNHVSVEAGAMIGITTLQAGSMNCILYKDWIILPAHIMMRPLPLTFAFKHYTCTISELPECYSFIGYDLLVIRRPRNLAPVRCYATLDFAKDGMTIQMMHKKPVVNKVLMTVTAEAYRTPEHRWEHQIPTAAGMCGSPVFDVASGKIVGIHILGDIMRKRNTFEAFPGDMMKLVNSNDPKIKDLYIKNRLREWNFEAEVHGHDSRRLINLQGDNLPISKFSRDVSIYSVENITRSAMAGGLFKPREVSEPRNLPPTVSTLHMTNVAYANGLLNTRHIFEGENPYWKQFKLCNPHLTGAVSEYEDKYLPSALNREAYWKDLLKYNRPLHQIKPNEAALHASMVKLIRVLRESGMTSTRIRTCNEVLEDIQWNKAAGPLYGMKKEELCKNMTMEDLTALAIHCRTELRRGKNAGVWNGSLKAELRPKEKVELNKTRVFTAAPITTLIGAKFYVDDFNKQFYATHLKAPHTVGINKFQNGWARVHDKLNHPGWLHGSGDGSRFDSSIDPFLFDIIYTIRCHFMCDEDRGEASMAMSHMFREFVFTPIHTINGNILIKRVGNNSGQPSTVVDNTLVLMLSFYYAYARKTNDLTFDRIDEDFCFVCNGDDNKFSLSPDFVAKHGGSFENEINELGLTYEFDDLTPDIMKNPYMSLTIVQVGERIGFQLNPERIVGIVQWIKKGGVLHAAQAAFAAMVEAFNDPSLFTVMHSYLVWLLVTHKDVLLYAQENDLGSVCYMDPCQVFALHYGSSEGLESVDFESDNESANDADDDVTPSLELQMDVESLIPEKGKNAKNTNKDEQSKRTDATAQGESSSPLKSSTEEAANRGDTNPPQGDPLVDDEIVEWVIPKMSSNIVTSPVPVVNGKKLWKRGILKNMPKIMFSTTSTMATQVQLTSWVEEVKKSLALKTDDAWTVVITNWCIWCANNGTSSEIDTSQNMEIRDGFGKVQEVPIEIFVNPAVENGGLRKIMRHFSGITYEILKVGKQMTAWGNKRGFTEKSMIPYAFDYYVVTNTTPKTVREQLAQSKAAAIGSGTVRKMILDGNIQGSHASYERHVDTDNSEYEHGSSVDQRPYLT
nr:polyprotein [Narcissus latent virus]